MSNPTSASSEFLLSRIARFSRLCAKLMEQHLAPLDITYQEVRIAGLLMGETDITQKELAEKLSVRAATLSVAIKKLEAQGLVERRTSNDDKRIQHLRLKPNKKISKVDKVLDDVESLVCHGISAKDLATAQAVIQKLIKNAQQEVTA